MLKLFSDLSAYQLQFRQQDTALSSLMDVRYWTLPYPRPQIGPPKRNKCDICGKTLNSTRGLKTMLRRMEHHRQTHNPVTPVCAKCDICGKTLNSTHRGLKTMLSRLERHRQTHTHAPPTPTPCVCGKTFKSAKGLKMHLAVFKPETIKAKNAKILAKKNNKQIKDKCVICGLLFTRWRNIDKHYELHYQH